MVGYVGSGQYCYANSLAMVLGAEAPPVGVIETLTGSPFGFELLGGSLPLFDPYGWSPDIGLDAAIERLGWRCSTTSGGTPEQAIERLRAACWEAPALVGPVDIRLLSYQFVSPPVGDDEDAVDHYVVAIAVDDEIVTLHDPQGFPYARIPVEEFLQAWQATGVDYVDTAYILRAGFVRVTEVSAKEALRGSLSRARDWLAGDTEHLPPSGTLGGAAGLERFAELAEAGLTPGLREFLAMFAVRVGTRRLADAAGCLASLGLHRAAAVADEQARILGGLQHPVMHGDGQALAAGLRRLAPTYGRLRAELPLGPG